MQRHSCQAAQSLGSAQSKLRRRPLWERRGLRWQASEKCSLATAQINVEPQHLPPAGSASELSSSTVPSRTRQHNFQSYPGQEALQRLGQKRSSVWKTLQKVPSETGKAIAKWAHEAFLETRT